MNYDRAMKMHLGNISRQVGHDVSKKYSYIVSQDDLTKAWIDLHDELGYPLMVDSRYRRAIVYNKKGLEKQIAELVNSCIISNIKELEKMVVEDLSKDIESMLNGITQTSNGVISVGKSSNGRNSATSRFASALAKGLVKGVSEIIDDMTNPQDI